MADSRWRVGGLTSTVTFAKTEMQVAEILAWFVADKIGAAPEGMTPAQVNQWRLDFAHAEALAYVVREARRNRLRELQAAQGSLETQADLETQL